MIKTENALAIVKRQRSDSDSEDEERAGGDKVAYKTFAAMVNAAKKAGWTLDVQVRMRADEDDTWKGYHCRNADPKAIYELHSSVDPHDPDQVADFNKMYSNVKAEFDKREEIKRLRQNEREAEKARQELERKQQELEDQEKVNRLMREEMEKRNKKPKVEPAEDEAHADEEDPDSDTPSGLLGSVSSFVYNLGSGWGASSKKNKPAKKSPAKSKKAKKRKATAPPVPVPEEEEVSQQRCKPRLERFDTQPMDDGLDTLEY